VRIEALKHDLSLMDWENQERKGGKVDEKDKIGRKGGPRPGEGFLNFVRKVRGGAADPNGGGGGPPTGRIRKDSCRRHQL